MIKEEKASEPQWFWQSKQAQNALFGAVLHGETWYGWVVFRLCSDHEVRPLALPGGGISSQKGVALDRFAMFPWFETDMH